MTKSRLLHGTALRSFTALSLVAGLATPAFAQQVQQDPTKAPPESLKTETEIKSGTKATADANGTPVTSPANTAAANGSIVVTGSRIKRPNLESPVPVTSVGGEEFFQTGNVSVGDYLNNLPSIRNTFTISNSTRFLGTTGLSLLDLRGLGTTRTLVLVNGRRHVPGDGSSAVDVNTIPTDLIDRVDVVTGGNSAVYGSDAIAGVVNFVLKQNYDGITVRGQAGVTKYHDLGSRYISVLAGQNFAGGRGNIVANFEIAQEDPAYMGVRGGWWGQQHRFVSVDTDPSGTPNGSDGVPDNVFYDDVRFPFFQNGSGVYFCCQAFKGGVIGIPYIFDKSGNLIPQTGTIVGRKNNFFGERYIGGNGSNGLEGTAAVVSPRNDRWSLNLLGHFTVSDAFEPFFEAKFVKQKARGLNAGPFFWGFGTATGSPREVVRLDNPFLSNQARNVIASYYGLDPATDGDFPVSVNGTATDLGNRDDRLTRETYRIVGGVRGRFNDDWNYEVSVNYGVARQKNRVVGNVNLQRFLLSLDAVRDPATGKIVCRSQIDPSAALTLEGLTGANLALAQSMLAQDVAQCVPGNFLGEGNLSPAAADYILQDTTSRQRFTQFDLTGFVSGDTSQFLNLPGGPIGFSLGAEYRQETLSSSQDPIVAAGLTFYNALGNIQGIPAFQVKEVFGELRAPILKDVPFFQELTVSAAGRISDYKGKTGTVKTFNVSGEWAPVRDIRFRANIARAVRAPNLSELYFPLSQNFAFLNDPCSQDFIGAGSSTRAANCAAAGIPTTYNYNRGPTYLYLSGGNPDLNAETSRSYTLGGVLQPRFIPGLSISADYYNISVKNVITAPTAQDIFNACYDLATLNNPFCTAFQRAPAGPIDPVSGVGVPTGPKGEPAYSLLLGSLHDVALNYAKLKVRGIDFEVAYRRQLGTIGRLDTRLTYTHVFQNDQFLTPTEPNRADQNLLELGDPKDAFNWDVNLTRGQIELGYKMRYIGHMLTSAFEDYFSKQDRPPQNADVRDIKWYPAFFYHDVRIGFNPTKKFNFYLGIDNITNKHPPLDVKGTGGGSGIYDTHGRFYYGGAVAKF